MTARRRGIVPARGLVLGAAALVSACTLTEVEITTAEEVLVGEVYVELVDDMRIMSAVLHGTLGTPSATLGDNPDAAEVRVRAPSGVEFVLPARPVEECIRGEAPGLLRHACYRLSTTSDQVQPGGQLELEILVQDGRRIEAVSTVPGDFELYHPLSTGSGERCSTPAGSALEVIWSVSEGAWAYISEATIANLPGTFSPDFPVTEDLALVGLSVSATDTTIVLPNEFGLFDRADSPELLRALQAGIPAGTTTQVVVAAVDRNYVNWARGGNFNPSGQVRVPSLRGDGIGVFGTLVSRSIFVEADGSEPDCTQP